MNELLDFFPPEEPDLGFTVHAITIEHIEYDEPDEFGIDPVECEYVVSHRGCPWRSDDCIVEGTISGVGLHQAIFGVWDKDHRLEAKTYLVQGWTSVTPATPNGPEEYDAGIELVEIADA